MNNVKSTSYILLSLFLFLSSCVSIERDIYFKNRDSRDEKRMDSSRPGSNFLSSPIKVTDQYDREVHVSIPNYAEGSYLWGIVIPIVPVFFLPQMKFKLNRDENLKVRCQVMAHYGPQFLKKWEHSGSRDLYVLTEQGVELSKKIDSSEDKDTCSSVNIQMPNGQTILPISTEVEGKSKITIFTFAVPASALSEFSLNVSEIKLNTGTTIKTDIRLNAILEDWTRYYIAPIAP